MGGTDPRIGPSLLLLGVAGHVERWAGCGDVDAPWRCAEPGWVRRAPRSAQEPSASIAFPGGEGSQRRAMRLYWSIRRDIIDGQTTAD